MIIPDLLSRLEAAKEGSRELDYLCHTAIGWVDQDQGGWERGNERTGEGWPSYTTSVDAALTLVPEGWRVGEITEYDEHWSIVLYGRVASNVQARFVPEAKARGKTFATTLCIAALKAEKQTTNQTGDGVG